MLSPDERINLLEAGTPQFIKDLRDIHEELEFHLYGSHKEKFIIQVQGYETDDQLTFRNLNFVSNKWLCEKLLNPANAIFNAKGGNIDINVTSNDNKKKLTSYLSKMVNGISLDNYIQSIAFDKYISDPGGLILTIINKNNKEEIEPVPEYRSINTIMNYKITGMQAEWIIFEPMTDQEIQELINSGKYPNITYSKKDKEKKIVFQWFITKEFYYIYKGTPEKDNKKISFEEVDKINNYLKEVPAITCSNLISSKDEKHISPISNILDLLAFYFRLNSNKSGYQLTHLFPMAWMLNSGCQLCNATGKYNGETCPACDGGGKAFRKNVSDLKMIDPPKSKDEPMITRVGGYEVPPESYDEQIRTELDWIENLAYESLWHTKNVETKNETATGKYIDSQQREIKINKYSDWLELVNYYLIRFIARAIFPASYKEVIVKSGRIYTMLTPAEQMEIYLKLRREGASIEILNYHYEQYLYGEFGKNKKEYDYHHIIYQLDPFPHKSLEQVQKINIPTELYNRKLYLSEYLKTKTKEEIIKMGFKKSEKDLQKYINNLNLKQDGNNRNKENKENSS